MSLVMPESASFEKLANGLIWNSAPPAFSVGERIEIGWVDAGLPLLDSVTTTVIRLRQMA